jgi:hypothetical protein
MRSLLIVCVVACLALTAGMANAANPGQISDNALAQMGLAGMQTMSDAQGAEIRGKGFFGFGVSTNGFAFASMPGGVAGSSYTASGLWNVSGQANASTGIGSGSYIGFGPCCIATGRIACGVVSIASSSASAR